MSRRSSASRHFVYDHERKRVVEVVETPARRPAATPFFDESTPRESMAMSVHSSQVEQANEIIQREGITGVYFDPRRRHNCVVTDARQRAKAIKVLSRHFGLGGVIHDDHDVFSEE